jgi:5-methylcytosine-specific restriction protein A
VSSKPGAGQLDELGLPILTGYLPRKNVGGVEDEIISLINLHWHREEPEAPTDDPNKLDTRVISARHTLARNPAIVPQGRKVPRHSTRGIRTFVRDPNVIGWILNAAKGICEMCENPAPFSRRDGEPYLEVHHLRQLAEGGPDQVDNALALCPNCHRRFHHGHDSQLLRKRALRKIKRLFDYPERFDSPQND